MVDAFGRAGVRLTVASRAQLLIHAEVKLPATNKGLQTRDECQEHRRASSRERITRVEVMPAQGPSYGEVGTEMSSIEGCPRRRDSTSMGLEDQPSG